MMWSQWTCQKNVHLLLSNSALSQDVHVHVHGKLHTTLLTNAYATNLDVKSAIPTPRQDQLGAI
jgi:hypothetical protein